MLLIYGNHSLSMFPHCLCEIMKATKSLEKLADLLWYTEWNLYLAYVGK